MKRRTLLLFTVVFTMGPAISASAQRAAKNPSAVEVFNAQIVSNMAVDVHISPRAGDPRWEERIDWGDKIGLFGLGGDRGQRATAICVLIEITPAILESATSVWAEGNAARSTAAQAEALGKLRKKYLREHERAFLLIARLIQDTSPDWWAIKLGPINDNLKLVELDRREGSVIRCETSLDERLGAQVGPRSCLVWMEDIVPRDDPTYRVTLQNSRFLVRLSETHDWTPARDCTTFSFRFETGEVKIAQLLEDGTPWDEILRKYAEPRLRMVEASVGKEVIACLRGFAADLLVSVLLRGL